MKIPSFCLGILKKKYEYWQKMSLKGMNIAKKMN